VAVWRPPAGPGVRLDSGVTAGSEIGQAFDSLLAKLIVSGATREQALERSRRALDEFVVEGLATALPFHRAVVRDPAFAERFGVHTRWIETEFAGGIEPYAGPAADPEPPAGRERVTVEVGGRRLEVTLPAGLTSPGNNAATARPPSRRSGTTKGGAAASGDSLTSPMQGTLVKVAVEEGQRVEAGELVVVLEAMKMEQPINAHKPGTVTKLVAEVGATVASGAVICEITD
jgi:acetyl-CoA/propionyl-CoA carboxylase biotin carboxyl carrier protein